MIRVLIVDDSATSRLLMRHIISKAPDMLVVGELNSGKQAVEQVRKLAPNVILMDIVMPEMDGMEATGQIMAIRPTPIVMISGAIEGRETEMAFQAIKRGALTLLPKPDGIESASFDEQATRLLSTVRAMAGVHVIHHHADRSKNATTGEPQPPRIQETLVSPPQIVGITSSTGGPAALAEIFQHLPADFRLPIVVVQHIAGDFLQSLITWLNHVAPLPVQLAPIGEAPQGGNIYFAPFGKHLYINEQGVFAQTSSPITYHTPSGDVLLESIAKQYGAAAIGVILTGMGADGARGLLHMRSQGAVTIAQNEKTSAVYGMPAEANRLGAVQYTLALNMIASMLKNLSEGESHE